MLSLDQISRADFAACLEQDFELITGTGGITLRLVEVRPAGEAQPGRPEPFVARLAGVPELRLPEGVHPLQNTTLGAMELSLVHVGADAAGSYFEAAVK